MPWSRVAPLAVALLAAVLLLPSLPVPAALAGPEDGADARPTGPTYRNKGLGVKTSGPEGWDMVADKVDAAPSWKRLATWNHKDTGAQVVLYTRPRSAATVDALMASVREEWNKSVGRLRLDGMRKIDRSAINPIAKVIVDGSFTRKGKAEKPKDGVPPPPPASTPMKVQATYYLGDGNEFLLYITTRASHWTRLRADLRQMRDTLAFDNEAPAGPTGEGSYRNEQYDFACRFPKDYTVVQPQRAHHVVKFVGLSAAQPVLSVYAFPYEESADADARRLVTYYTDDKAGTAERGRIEVSGTEAAMVSAAAMIEAVDQRIFIAVVKRGDTCYRLRCVVPAEEEARGEAAFRTFVANFRFGA